MLVVGAQELERLRYRGHGAGGCFDKVLDLLERRFVQASIGLLGRHTVSVRHTAASLQQGAPTYHDALHQHIELVLELLVFFAKLFYGLSLIFFYPARRRGGGGHGRHTYRQWLRPWSCRRHGALHLSSLHPQPCRQP